MSTMGSLLQRYRDVWSQSWRQRKSMDMSPRQADELQFLPTALELQETPVHPAPRIFIWGIMGFALLALLWAYIGKIEVVAVAPGKIVPNGKTKLIQPRETAVVKAIHVNDGQMVKSGELLVELDPTAASADVSRIQSELLASRIDSARSTSMLDAINQQQPPAALTGTIANASPEQVRSAERWLQGQYQEYRSNLELVDAEIRQRSAEIQSAQSQVASLRKTLPIATQLAKDYERLLTKQYVSRHAYLEKEQIRLDLQRQLSVQQASVLQNTAARDEAQRRREAVIAQNRRAMLDQQQEANKKAATLVQELAKARYQENLTNLKAPVAGTVQQLAIHTVGGVVTPAQPLMVIVPTDQPVEVEAMLENKDVGFIHVGQPVTVKVETFTFTKYGTIDGEILSVSNDAIEDEKRGLIYSSRIRLKSDHVQVNGQRVALSPGMSITAEIKTDQRRVIDYFLSPLQQHLDESLRER
ncbi:HlyD family type I secretion periplasmic adaptor subunit [Xenorhabdus szentirmaii]|uniref:Membrane fusion protein (MFP) family protein n=1 Tax=Xenorhabdus szentirmaii DSM 16338 TaxID=1427518 RepID=W1J516_9GAMM|nr:MULTISPECIES: HlyD family type I secretion periplasmic adaptor subunit [Xenorhabdus]MBD2804216.1 HlyD family type I secretion periplasmic adaptor subunit [Xenorhabdus sp. ZM]MBD2821915.1 HlyD family type I secretion periplasmic adaptor subunit [Xenorhabdus sp. 42]PHM30912.1 hemolysin secretion protein HlyD [Xenorhabdus szentirmaii DSM 16338]PHM44493.1 hemolysin secretion protein HlyD [Xenorhabdus szentirmaii]CDL85158.1 Similar to hemolysin export system membrane fusion protein HlyD of Esche